MTLLSTPRVARTVGHISSLQSDLYICFGSLSLQPRHFSSDNRKYAAPTLNPSSLQDRSARSGTNPARLDSSMRVKAPAYVDMTPAQRAARAAQRAREKLEEQQKKYSDKRQLGGLAENSFFAERKPVVTDSQDLQTSPAEQQHMLSNRSPENMSFSLNPRPKARALWQRKMLIRHLRQKGRLPRHVQIARTERSHLSKSHFFKTSMKKLAPLARQIAGKSIDEAILQMRFSKKKAAIDVRAHLVQARDEAIVIKGMGLSDISTETAFPDSPVESDPGITPPLPHQNPTKSTKPGHEKSETNIYVAEAWVNRGPYGKEPEFRARGRVNILRPPWTGISVLLKEEKTRTREKAEKEAKAIKKRMGKSMWQQLPDRPITRQSQYVLW